MSVEFLIKVLPWPGENDPGYINLHWMEKDRRGMPGRPVNSPNHLYETRHFYDRDGKPRDFYMCMSRQSEVEKRTSKSTGRQYDSAVRNHQNALALKSLFIDLDIKNYTTAMDALKDFERFIREASLPWPNAIVYSGGGYHFYWAMSEAIPVMEWQPLANALSEAIKRHKLLGADTQCTVDAARVLRLPPTMNHKYDPPRKVEVKRLEPEDFSPSALAGRLSAYMVPTAAVPQVWSLPKTEKYGPVSNNLAAGVEAQPAYKVPAADVIHECPLLKEALTTGGAAYHNPLWNMTTFLATFLEDGRSMAHLMSRKHPTYSPGDTDELYERKEQERTQRNMGWPTCAAFSSAGSTVCQTCPHVAKGKSPLNFAHANGKGVSETLIPEKYFLKNDLIWRRVTDAEGKDESYAVYDRPMTNGHIETIKDALHLVFNCPKRIEVPLALTGNIHRLQECLHGQCMMLDPELKQPQHVSRFLSMWADQLNQKKEAINTVPCGWERNNGKIAGFVYDGQLYTENGTKEATHLDGALRQSYRCLGDKNPWYDARELLQITRPDHMAIVASAFASPLATFTGEKGLIVSAYSTMSAAGKSTMVSFAQSVWGDPRTGIQQLTDTEVSMAIRLSKLDCMPSYWDEARLDGDRAADRVFGLTAGKDKQRATRDAQLREIGTWDCMMVFLSNSSVLRSLVNRGTMSNAGLMRVFEFEMASIAKDEQIVTSEVSRAIARLSHNFGFIGAEYSRVLGRDHKAIDEMVGNTQAEYRKLVDSVPDERFWIATMATLEVGAFLANRLMFLNFDIPRLRDFLLKSHANMRAEVSSRVQLVSNRDDVLDIYLQFKKEAQGTRRYIVTDTTTKANIIYPKMGSSGYQFAALAVHSVMSIREDRLSLDSFKDWLQLKGYNSDLIVKGMYAKLEATKPKRICLGAGTEHVTVPEPVICISHSKLPLDETLPAPT